MANDFPELDPMKLLTRVRGALRRLKDHAAKLRTEEAHLADVERELESDKHLQRVEISTISVVRATLAIMGLVALAWLLMQIADILILFFIAAFLAIALDPIVTRLRERFRIPRGISIIGLYIIFFSVFGIVISSFIPILTTEIPNLVNTVLNWLSHSFGVDTSVIQAQISELQTFLNDIQHNLSQENIKAGLSVLQTVGANAFAVLSSVAGGIFSVTLVLVTTFFMVLEEDGIKTFFMSLFPRRFHTYIVEKAKLVEDKFGAWLRGQLLLMLAVGVLMFIALKILGVNYALTLATFSGLTELIPYVGPFFAVIPALIIAVGQDGPLFALLVLGAYIAVQQLENNVLVPLIMERAVGLSPVVTMFAMLVGASFPEYINPVVGIILSVPVATAVSVFVNDYAGRSR